MIRLTIKIPLGEVKPGMCSQVAQHGIKPIDFCRKINEISIPGIKNNTKVENGIEVLVKVNIISKTEWNLKIMKPSIATLIKQLEKYPSEEDILSIAEYKMEDMLTSDINKAIKSVKGTISSMKLNK